MQVTGDAFSTMPGTPAAGSETPAAGQRWDAVGYAHNARFVAELGMPVVDLLAPQAHEHILDLGCGDGALTEKLAGYGCSVVGIDASPDLVAAARARGLNARMMDAHDLAFDHGSFDAVFSNAALHWMSRPDAVIAGVAHALKPGGRFVGEMGGEGNVGRIVAALVEALDRRGLDGAAAMPWYFPSVEDYRQRLEAAGFEVDAIALIERPTPLPTGMRGWLATFASPFLKTVPEDGRSAVLDDVTASVEPDLRDGDGQWWADYVRLRFAAVKPAD